MAKKKIIVPEVIPMPTISDRKLYFNNNCVEDLATKYVYGGCVDVALRDEIMSHAEELIRQVIRAHGLHKIYPGYEESAFGDLFQTGWGQIERTLYKYRALPYCHECYNLRRPQDSVLYEPAENEYGILSPQEIAEMELKCPTCKKMPAKIIYRGTSKIFNLWCVHPDTMLFTTDGINAIKNVVSREGYDDRQEIWTLGMGEPRKVVAGISKMFEKPVRTIKTEMGYSITCTPQHGIYGIFNDEPNWEITENIKVGDLIALQYNQQFYVGNNDISDIILDENGDWGDAPKIITEELAYILGLYVAEGSYTDGQLCIYNIDKDVVDRLVNNSLGLNFINRPEDQVTYICNRRFIELVKKMGFTRCKAPTKFIPQRILKCSESVLISFISGMFDGDGHSSRHSGNVGYTSTSKLLIDQLRMLLLNAGILTKLSIDKRTVSYFNRRGKKYISAKQLSYQLICGTDASRIFYNTVGFKICRKQEKQKHLRCGKDEIYGLNNKFRNLYKKYGCGKLGYNRIRTIIDPKRNMALVDNAIYKLTSWDDHQDDADYKYIVARLNERINNDIKTTWLPIIDIVESTSKVCEISVENDDHSYIANGMISHNSQVSVTVIRAFIKKESRDYKNADTYKNYLDSKHRVSVESDIVKRFISEAQEVFSYNDTYLIIVDALSKIIETDDRPYEGLITKLVSKTNLPRSQVASFLKMIRMRSTEFTDSPINDEPKPRDSKHRESQQFEED